MFIVTWRPGPDSVAGLQQVADTGMTGLVIYGDPDSLALLPPDELSGYPRFLVFLRQLSAGAEELATELERRLPKGAI